MRVLVAGATGFIGRALVPVLQREGHTVVVWVRSETRARGRLGDEVEILETRSGLPPQAAVTALTAALDGCDAVVNLAGEPLMGERWTLARRQVLRDSRVGVTAQLVQALEAAHHRPRVLVSGSAVGYYGDRGDEVLDEHATVAGDFLAGLCRDWEDAARVAEGLGIRVVLLRTGVVLGRDGGALAQMLPPFRFGVGGPVGSGLQYLPWIHLHDLVRVLAAALVDGRIRGPVNGVAPTPVTSREFARALGHALHRPAVLPLPAPALHAIFGEAASVLLGSQRVDPAALRACGFPFAFPTVDTALADILGGSAVEAGPATGPTDPGGDEVSRLYLEGRQPTCELRTTTTIEAPLDEVFAFFSKAGNLGMLTPAAMGFSLDGRAPAIGEGSIIDYRLRIGPVPLRWRSRIVGWAPGRRFIDLQVKGPYRSWWHEHSFRAAGGRTTVMDDRVRYAPPLGVLGRLVNRLFIVPALRRVFQYRADVIRLRFGAS